MSRAKHVLMKTYGGKTLYYDRMTGIGPMTTANINEAHVYKTFREGQDERPYHWFLIGYQLVPLKEAKAMLLDAPAAEPCTVTPESPATTQKDALSKAKGEA